MSWTSKRATHYLADGKVDRKAECDALYTWEDCGFTSSVLDSCMVGTTYYAAVKHKDKNTKKEMVFGAVCETAGSDPREPFFNFGYKGIPENHGPIEDDCPESILDLLTYTDDPWAKGWRERCRNNLKRQLAVA